MSVEKVVQVDRLFERYGPLLTEKQRRLVDLHYRQDLSLGEIAAEMGVTRQAVHDLLRRATEALEEYEARLGWAARDERQRAALQQVLERLDAGLLAEAKTALLQLIDEE